MIKVKMKDKQKESTALKPHSCPLAGLLLATLFISAILSEPCAAAFIPCNDITLEKGGMVWDYNEKITEKEAVFFRDLIDRETGNNDGFVNAWEILKIEVLLKERMEKGLAEKPDIRFNSTSDTVELKDIEFRISREALGRIEKNSSITNRASVAYNFKEEVGPGTAIWLAGTPDSNVTITLPPGLDAELTEGLINTNAGFENDRTVLRGNFGSEGNITLWISENKSIKAELKDMKMNMHMSAENESRPEEDRTANKAINIEEARKPSRFLQNISKKLTGT